MVLVAQEAWATGQFGPAVNALARAAQLRILRESRSVSAGGGTVEDARNVLVIPAGHDIDLEALASIPSAKVVLRSGNASIGAGFPPATPSD